LFNAKAAKFAKDVFFLLLPLRVHRALPNFAKATSGWQRSRGAEALAKAACYNYSLSWLEKRKHLSGLNSPRISQAYKIIEETTGRVA
jgi:hypothetical protein